MRVSRTGEQVQASRTAYGPTGGRVTAVARGSPRSHLAPLQSAVGNRVMQRLLVRRGGPATVQREGVEDFDTYKDAKNFNRYSRAHLDKQKHDVISDHQGKTFSADQARKIYAVNRAAHADREIHSDDIGDEVLHLQDTAVTPHVDHRFPKSKGGTNSFANAAVISANENISKSAKTDLDSEPAKALPAYAKLKDADHMIGTFHEFSQAQKKEIYAANTKYYKVGSVVSDTDKTTHLAGYDSSEVPHIDHITARSEGGTNFYFNAQVLPADANILKSGARGQTVDEDWNTSAMTLAEYYENKNRGTLDAVAGGDYDSDEERKFFERKNTKRKRSQSQSGGGSPAKKRKVTPKKAASKTSAKKAKKTTS